jgi:hypothetical protein
VLANGDKFGDSIAAIGDLDGDGVADIAVGAPSEYGSTSGGVVDILFMNADGTVKSTQKIASGVGGGPSLAVGDYFGHSVASLGDLNGDGITDIAVGTSADDTGGTNRGAVYVLFLNTNGTVKSSQKIAGGVGGGPTLANNDSFGTSVSSLGDLDGDGVTDLAVGAIGDDSGGVDRGAVYVLLMNANGTVKSTQKIASGTPGGPVLANSDLFGVELATLGDLDGDGVTELAAGVFFDSTGGSLRGAVDILFLNSNGTVKSTQKIASGVGGGPTLADGDHFGTGLAALGDLDGDGIKDLAVGAYQDGTGGLSRGAVYMLFLNANGTVKASQKIANGTGGGPVLSNYENFGTSLAAVGDLNGDGLTELMVGAERDDWGGNNRGAAYVLFLTPANISPVFTSPTTANVPENTTAVLTVTASDADIPAQTLTYSIVGGADQSKFSITSGGVLSFLTAPNYEVPTDADGNNVYLVTVQVSDGHGGVVSQTINVSVTPVNDNSPVFTSPDSINVPENSTLVETVTASDADLPAQTVTFSIVGGADQSKFSITSSGVLSFIAAPNYEAPADANGNNIYVLIVQASDGSLTTLQALLVTVTNVSEGDYNLNGAVDAADYVLWRHTLGTSLANGTGADGSGNGVVDQADYDVWRGRFGSTPAGSGAVAVASAASSSSIEPVYPAGNLQAAVTVAPLQMSNANVDGQVGISWEAVRSPTGEEIGNFEIRGLPGGRVNSWGLPRLGGTVQLQNMNVSAHSQHDDSAKAATHQDHALIDWLGSPGARTQANAGTYQLDNADIIESELLDELDATLDLAFDSL